jgi:hypothetical protein
MATRNGSGRNIVSSNPNGSKVAYARYLAIEKAKSLGKYNSKIVDCITSACSIQAIKLVEIRFGLSN